jgi:hypothetical protein
MQCWQVSLLLQQDPGSTTTWQQQCGTQLYVCANYDMAYGFINNAVLLLVWAWLGQR